MSANHSVNGKVWPDEAAFVQTGDDAIFTPEINFPDPEDEGHEPAMFARAMQRERLVNPWGSSRVQWIRSHKLFNAYKVVLNVYDLCCGWCNNILQCMLLGGIYHSAIELGGEEFCFGGHFSEDLGIMTLQQPLHKQRREVLRLIQRASEHEQADLETELQMLPRLRKRIVIGFWLGAKPEFEQLFEVLQNQGGWRGPAYQLLSRNCNHFARALTEMLLASPAFQPAPGMSELKHMVPGAITRISDFALCCCWVCPCVRAKLNMNVPLAQAKLDAFHGTPRTLRDAASPTRVNAPPAAQTISRTWDPPDNAEPTRVTLALGTTSNRASP